jgi:hypothetical protein
MTGGAAGRDFGAEQQEDGMLKQRLWHKSLTNEVIAAACERRQTTLDDPGFCLICGREHHGIEPDAQNYTCESCGAEQVFGAEELLLVVA